MPISVKMQKLICITGHALPALPPRRRKPIYRDYELASHARRRAIASPGRQGNKRNIKQTCFLVNQLEIPLG